MAWKKSESCCIIRPMRLWLAILGLMIVFPVFAGAPVEQDGPLAPCKGADSSATRPTSPWSVELASSFSKQEALDGFNQAKQAYPDVLGDYEPVLVEYCDLSLGTDIRYGARIGFDDRDAADQLCAKLQEAGGACIVQKN
jgi:SPOR domain